MKKNYQSQTGIAHLGLIALVLIIALVGFVGWKIYSGNRNNHVGPSKQSDQTEQTTTADEADIALQNLGVSSLYDATDFTTQATGDFTRSGHKGLYVFGDPLPGGSRLNPNYEVASVKANTSIIAAIDGIVAFIKEQPESKDYEVFLQPQENSIWTIGYDHITNLKVTKGQQVKVGDALGNAAVQNNGLHRYEIQINKGQNEATIHVCPSTLLASKVKDTILADLKATQEKWEAVSGLELYDLRAQKPTGCFRPTLTPKEAGST